jgi:hypothetical protein
MRKALAALVALGALGGSAAAHADVAPARLASPRLIHVPTAWLLPRDAGWGSAGVDHRGAGHLELTAALGGIAQVDLGVSDRIVACAPCGDEPDAAPAWLGSAGFKLGWPPARHAGRPALALGVRRSVASRVAGDPQVGEAYLVASLVLGGLHGHLGGAAWQASETPRAVRPFAGVEWRPARYPRSTLLAELSWIPELGRRDLRWLAAWGARYQAFSWGAIDLAVRHRQGDELADAAVLVRVHGALALGRRAL